MTYPGRRVRPVGWDDPLITLEPHAGYLCNGGDCGLGRTAMLGMFFISASFAVVSQSSPR